MEHAEVPDKAARLLALLSEQQGTVVVSPVQLSELCRTSPITLGRVHALLQAASPHLTFFDPRPKVVLRSEELLSRGVRTTGPFSMDLLRTAVRTAEPWPPDLAVVFSELADPRSLAAFEHAVGRHARFLNRLLAGSRRRLLSDARFRSQVRSVPPVRPFPLGTRFLLQELWRGVIRDTRFTPSRNDWLDFAHTLVPLAYCDAVLLDSGWAHRAKVALRRLRSAGATFQAAAVFSHRDDAAFWAYVSSHTATFWQTSGGA